MTHLTCFFHLSVRVCQQDVITFAPSIFEQPVTHHPARHKNIPPDASITDNTSTPQLSSCIFPPAHKTTILQHHSVPSYHHFPLSYNNLQHRLQQLTATPLRCAIMSDLCYNCATCHLTAGPCLRDLVQCEICYSWGHLYIFCPRSVTIKDRAYNYWGTYRMALQMKVFG